MTVFIGNKDQVLVSTDGSLFLNEDGVVDTKNEKEEKLAESYGLKKLEDLAKKYLDKKPEKEKKSKE